MSYEDSINDTEIVTGDDVVIPHDDEEERNYYKFRNEQENAFGGLYGC